MPRPKLVTDEQARAIVDAWKRSGLSINAFCAARKMWPSRFHELRRRAQPSLSLVPIEVVGALVAPEPLQLVLPNGCMVRVPANFDAATLRRVVEALC
jgi:hypothetical protein